MRISDWSSDVCSSDLSIRPAPRLLTRTRFLYNCTNQGPARDRGAMRQGNVREALLEAAAKLFSRNGYNAVSMREIAKAANANVGSLTYHFGSKANLLREIYQRHTAPMNRRRLELLGEARRIQNPDERLMAILRAYVLPAYSPSSDHDGGDRKSTRLNSSH